LVVGCEDARGDYGAVRAGVAEFDGWVERMPVARTSCVLVELGGEDVFVVSNGDDGLEDKNAGSCYSNVVGAVVGMFPEDVVVDFVAADYVWELEWVSRAGVMPAVEISYMPQAVAT
jgi:hypothetical protein